METTVFIPKNLEQFYKNGISIDDFKNNPCLFPLYLFQYFREKYGQGNEIEKEHNTFYSRDSVYCKTNETEQTSWLVATTRFDHVCFVYEIGEKDYVPFSEGIDSMYADKVANVQLQVFAKKIENSFWIKSFRFAELFACNKIACEIEGQLKKHGLHYSL